jgi:hypothetical protein
LSRDSGTPLLTNKSWADRCTDAPEQVAQLWHRVDALSSCSRFKSGVLYIAHLHAAQPATLDGFRGFARFV